MKSTVGKNLKITVWGGSHEPSIGVDIEGLPKGFTIDMQRLEAFLRRRAPGNSPFATRRNEADIPIPVSGLAPAPEAEEKTESGSCRYMTVTSPRAVIFEIKNTDTRSQDYRALGSVPRPGHADFTAGLRYSKSLNMAGGGPFSARMTAPLCIAGGIALQMLEREGITIGAHIYSIGDIKDSPLDTLSPDPALAAALKEKDMAVICDRAEAAMKEAILKAKEDLDSLGGIIEVWASGLPGGIGGAMYDGLEGFLAPIFFGIPAVKGVEFGAGFEASRMKGSQNNDPFYFDGDTVKTRTNNHGGILGGITSGMPLIARIAFKPTPSISREQDSVDLHKRENTKLIIKGRHDPCVAVRAVPVTEAAMALGILDCMMEVENDTAES